jgi:hypothetical protein
LGFDAQFIRFEGEDPMREPVEILRKEVQQRVQLANSQGGWEGSHTDFKRILGKERSDLAKLLRHVLAFANTPRRTDALIIFGVDEDKILRVFEHVGVTENGFPAKERIDQIVHHYTKLKGVFVDDTFTIEGKRTPYIVIPLQYEGPYTLTQPLAGLDSGTVYCRYGSMSAPATDRDEQQMKEDWDRWFLDCRYAESANSLVSALQSRFPGATSLQDMGKFVRVIYSGTVADEFGIQTVPVLLHAYWGFEPVALDAVEAIKNDSAGPQFATKKLIAARFASQTQDCARSSGIRCYFLDDIYFVNDPYALLCREFLKKWENDKRASHLTFVIDLDYRVNGQEREVNHSILSFMEKQLRASDRVATVVHAGFGSGKTVTARELVAQLHREYLRGNVSAPKALYVDVNNMDVRARRDECIQSQLLRLRLNRETVDQLVAQVLNNEIHLVFDGVDEMARPYTSGGRRECIEILRDVGNMCAAAYFVRSSYFAESDEMVSQFGRLAHHDLDTRKQRLDVAEILPLRAEQVTKYLDDRLGATEGAHLRRTLHRLKVESFLRDPLIVSIIAEYGVEGVEAAAEEDKKAQFLSGLVERLVNREQTKGIRGSTLASNIPLFLRVLHFVAFSMICRGYSSLAPTQLDGFVHRALQLPNSAPEMVDAFRTMSWINRTDAGSLEFRHEILTVICAAKHICSSLENRNLLDLVDWQEAAPLRDQVCEYAGRILNSDGVLGAAVMLGRDAPLNVRSLLVSLLEVAKHRVIEDTPKMHFDAKAISAICRGITLDPTLIPIASDALFRSLGSKRRIHVLIPLLWLLQRNESQESTYALLKLLELDITGLKGTTKERNFTHLLKEVKEDPANLMDVMMLRELHLTAGELLDSSSYASTFQRILQLPKLPPALFHYAERSLAAIAEATRRRQRAMHEHEGKKKPRKTYTTAG